MITVVLPAWTWSSALSSSVWMSGFLWGRWSTRAAGGSRHDWEGADWSISLPGRISRWLSNKTKPPCQRCRYPSPTCLAGVSFILKFLAFSLSLSINSDRDEPPTHFSVWLDARFGRCNSEWLCQVAKQARNFFGNFKSAKVHTTTKCKLVLTSFWQLWGKATKRWVQ